MRFRNILFDLDGTLLDTAPGIFWSLRRCFEALDMPALTDAQLRAFIGPPLYESFGQHCGLEGEANERAVQAYQKYFNEQGGGKDRHDYYPGMTELLKRLSSARAADGSPLFRLFVATTKPQLIAQELLRSVGYADYFEYIGGAGTDKRSAHKDRVIERVLAAGALKPEDCLMVGDRSYDIAGAHVWHIKAAAARWGFGTEEEFIWSGADLYFDSPAALGAFLLDGAQTGGGQA